MHAFERARTLAHKRLGHHLNRTTSNQDRTLVIIDMQSKFMNIDENSIVPAICTLVRHAKENNWGIIVVEFYDMGNTDERISELLAEYPYCQTVYKNEMDGSKEILEAINCSPNLSSDIVVCGIYGPECVSATVDGLLMNSTLSEVDVVEDAVCPAYCPYGSIDNSREDDYQLRARQVKVTDIVNCTPTIRTTPVNSLLERIST